MTNKDILRIAMEQSATDLNCSVEDLLSDRNVVVNAVASEGARKYLNLPYDTVFVSYGGNIVASAGEGAEQSVRQIMLRAEAERAFSAPAIFDLNESLKKHGLCVKSTAEYFLPDIDRLKRIPCSYTLKLLTPPEFKGLYRTEWGNALCKKRKQLDMLAVGAYDGDALVGLAGASADCEKMWQIGMDVLPEYRNRGIGAAMTSALTLELIRTGKVPFYSASWCNVKSVKAAVRCGYIPVWVEIIAGKYVKNK